MLCGAHTPALSIKDALKKDQVSKITLDIARKVAKKLRSPNLMLKLRERGTLKPILDVPIRWRSTYEMIERLIILKPIILDFGTFNEDISLTEEQWSLVELLKNDLEAPRNLQDRLITAGALLAEWKLMEFVCQQNEQSFSHYALEILL